jgi:hypothetical protein
MSTSSVFRTRCHTRYQPGSTCQHWSVDSLDAQPNRCHGSAGFRSLIDTRVTAPLCISSRSILGVCRRLLRRTLRTGLLFSAITLRSSIPALRLVEGRVAMPVRSVGANAAADAARARMEDAAAVEEETFMVRSGKSTRAERTCCVRRLWQGLVFFSRSLRFNVECENRRFGRHLLLHLAECQVQVFIFVRSIVRL